MRRLRAGEITFGRFAADHQRNFDRLAGYYAWRLDRCWGAPVDIDDLRQIALLACWQAVHGYRYLCPLCPRMGRTGAQLRRHTEKHHGAVLGPKVPLKRYVEGEVGRALDHEARRYLRRQRWGSDAEVPEQVQAPQQEAATALRLLVAAAQADLDDLRCKVLEGMALDLPRGGIPGLTGRQVGRLREQLRQGWLKGKGA